MQTQSAPRFAETDGDDQFLPEFQTVDLSAGIRTDDWSITAYFENVFNEKYWLGDTGGVSIRGTQAFFLPRRFGLRYEHSF